MLGELTTRILAIARWSGRAVARAARQVASAVRAVETVIGALLGRGAHLLDAPDPGCGTRSRRSRAPRGRHPGRGRGGERACAAGRRPGGDDRVAVGRPVGRPRRRAVATRGAPDPRRDCCGRPARRRGSPCHVARRGRLHLLHPAAVARAGPCTGGRDPDVGRVGETRGAGCAGPRAGPPWTPTRTAAAARTSPGAAPAGDGAPDGGRARIDGASDRSTQGRAPALRRDWSGTDDRFGQASIERSPTGRLESGARPREAPGGCRALRAQALMTEVMIPRSCSRAALSTASRPSSSARHVSRQRWASTRV